MDGTVNVVEYSLHWDPFYGIFIIILCQIKSHILATVIQLSPARKLTVHKLLCQQRLHKWDYLVWYCVHTLALHQPSDLPITCHVFSTCKTWGVDHECQIIKLSYWVVWFCGPSYLTDTTFWRRGWLASISLVPTFPGSSRKSRYTVETLVRKLRNRSHDERPRWQICTKRSKVSNSTTLSQDGGSANLTMEDLLTMAYNGVQWRRCCLKKTLCAKTVLWCNNINSDSVPNCLVNQSPNFWHH